MDTLHTTYFKELLTYKIKQNELITYDSFFELIEEYLAIEKSIEHSNENTAKILEKSRQQYLKDIKETINYSPFKKYKNIYKDDLNVILKLLKEEKPDLNRLKINLTTLSKKRTYQYFDEVYYILTSNRRVEFQEILIMVDNVLREIQHHQISFENIKSYLKDLSKDQHICQKLSLEIFNSKRETSKKIYCTLNIWLPINLEDKEVIYIDGTKLIKIFDNKLLPIEAITQYGEDIQNVQQAILEKNILSKYGKNLTGLYVFELSNQSGTDEHSKIRNLAYYLKEELNYFNLTDSQPRKQTIHDLAIIFRSKEEVSFFSMKNKPFEDNPAKTKRFKKDKSDFITAYIEDSFGATDRSSSLKSIFNLLDLIENSNNMTTNNQLISLWACLEKICVDLDENSIIQRVLSTMEKSHLLYTVKKDLNSIWHSLIKNKFHEKIKDIESLITDTDMGDDGVQYPKYQPIKLINYLKNIPSEDQDTIQTDNILLFAEITIFLGNINSKENIKKYLDRERYLVSQDINRIYRHRNILTHSNHDNIKNIEYFVIKLNQYINALISILIHYTMRNKSVNIKDVIFSIDSSYDFYVQQIKNIEPNVDDLKKLIAPRYLFL